MLSVVLIFQCLNIVISNIQGPSAVAEFNVAQRYFGVVHMVFTIIVVPFWSAFTDAYAKRDYKWMKTSQKKLEMILILCITSLIVMYFGADLIIDIWTNGKISVHHNLSFMLVAFTFSQSVSSLYMTLINGIGKIRLQLVIYMSFAVISLPMIYYGCKELGLWAALLWPTLTYLVQAIIGRIQLDKILREKATGIWNK
jgi:O-antigen/teichoic acid export membrane protein